MLLGVADDVIAEDYLLTNRFYAAIPPLAAICPRMSGRCSGRCKPPFLAAAFEAIDGDYGDLENYLAGGARSRVGRTRGVTGALSRSLSNLHFKIVQ